MDTIKSPVTHKNSAYEVEKIRVEDIVNAYENINISGIKSFFSINNDISIYRCNDTGYRFYYPYDIFGGDKFYSYLQNQRKYYADWRWEHGMAFDQIRPRQKILEIGCGTGNFLQKIKEEKNAECVGLELNQDALIEARSRGLNVFNQTIEEHAVENKNKYDVVCSFQVLEHVWDVKSFLGSSLTCLKKGGLLMVGVPNNNPYLFRYDKFHALNLPPHHAGLWDEKSLKNLEKHFDMKIEKIIFEPLFEIGYFWDVQRNHWKEHNKVAYLLTSVVSRRFEKWRNFILPAVFKGRNIFATYSKK